MSSLNIEWIKCHHGVEKRNHCLECEKEKSDFFTKISLKEQAPPLRIPIYRGCNNKDGCFCSGRCKDIIGYRDPLYKGEKIH